MGFSPTTFPRRKYVTERTRKAAEERYPRSIPLPKNKQTPLPARVMAAVTVAYALSPIDLIPDFIPVLGQLDDLLPVPAFIALTIKLIPSDVW